MELGDNVVVSWVVYTDRCCWTGLVWNITDADLELKCDTVYGSTMKHVVGYNWEEWRQ